MSRRSFHARYVMPVIVALLVLLILPFSLEVPEVGGRVVDAHRGSALEDVFIEVRHAGTGRLVGRMFTDADGAFRMELRRAGDYILRASRMGYAEDVRTVEAAAGGASSALVIELPLQGIDLGEIRVR